MGGGGREVRLTGGDSFRCFYLIFKDKRLALDAGSIERLVFFFSQDDTDWRGPVIECVWLSLATPPSQGIGLKWEWVGCLQMEDFFLLRELMPLWGSCSKGGFTSPLSTVLTSWTI